MATHSTGWEDGGLAKLLCSEKKDLDQILDAQNYAGDDVAVVCGGCGARVKLIWDVHVEVVP